MERARRRQRRFTLIAGSVVAVFVTAAFVPLRGAARQAAPAQVPAAAEAAVTSGVREAAWSPDGKRIAATWFDAIWTMSPDGKNLRRLVSAAQGWAAERDPAWSPDGREIAFSASVNGEFDLWVAPAGGGAVRRLTSLEGDERWPSWTKDGHIVFSRRPPHGAWRLVTAAADGTGETITVSADDAAEWQGAVSPDGRRIAFMSDREAEPNNDADVWVRELGASSGQLTAARARHTHARRGEPSGLGAGRSRRVAYAAAQAGGGGSIRSGGAATAATTGTPGATGAAGGAGARSGPGLVEPRRRAVPTEVLASCRHLGVPAWSPDGQWLVIATFATSSGRTTGIPIATTTIRRPRSRAAISSAVARARAARGRRGCAAVIALVRRRRTLDVGVRSGLADAEGHVPRGWAVRRGVGRAARRSTARRWRRQRTATARRRSLTR